MIGRLIWCMAQHASGDGDSDSAPPATGVATGLSAHCSLLCHTVSLSPTSCHSPAPFALFVLVNRCSSPPSALPPVPLCPSLCVRDCPQGHCSFLSHHSSLLLLSPALRSCPRAVGRVGDGVLGPSPVLLAPAAPAPVVFVTLAPTSLLRECPLFPVL